MLNLKFRIPSYFMCILAFWYSTEFILGTTLKNILGIPVEVLNQGQAYIVLILLVIQIIFFQRYALKEIIIISTASIFIMLATILSGELTLMSFWLFIVAGKNMDFDRIVRMIYRISIVLLSCVVLLNFTGILEDYTTYRGMIVRYSLGFAHPNTLGQKIFILVACHFYLRFYRLNTKDCLLAILAIIFCYKVPNSMSAVILLMIMLICIFIYKIFQKMNKVTYFLKGMILGALGCNIISLVLSRIDLGKYPLLQMLDLLISRRFSLCHIVFQTYDITLFGQKVYIYEKDRILAGLAGVLNCDNAYCSILITYGIVVYIIFSFTYLHGMYLQMKNQRVELIVFLFLCAVYGVMEHTLFVLSANIFLLTLSDVIYKFGVKNNKKRTHFFPCCNMKTDLLKGNL